jgi:hypothetical protein
MHAAKVAATSSSLDFMAIPNDHAFNAANILFHVARSAEKADPWDLPAGLRPYDAWPQRRCCHTAQQSDEFTPLHVRPYAQDQAS